MLDKERKGEGSEPSAQPEKSSRAGESIELVRQAQGGDRAALEQLLRRYYPRVRRIVRLRIGRRLRAHLESVDILQETFAEAVRRFDRFEMRDESSLIHWLGKIAESEIRGALDYHGAQKRDARREVPFAGLAGLESEHELMHQPAAGGLPPVEELVLGEDVSRLEECMDQLPEEQREIIIHRYFEAADWKTIAGWMGLGRADTARMRCSRALIELERLCRRRRED